MRWAEIRIRVLPASVEAVSAVLNSAGCNGVAVEDPNAVSSDPFAEWVVRDEGTRSSAGVPCCVTGYLPVDDRLEPALDDLSARLDLLRQSGIDPGVGPRLRPLGEEAWAEAWKAQFQALRGG